MSQEAISASRTADRVVVARTAMKSAQTKSSHQPDKVDQLLAKHRVSLDSILASTPWSTKGLH